MSEYINKEKAKEILNKDYAYAAAKLLDEVPVEDVTEVKHGKWITVEKENIWGNKTEVLKCTACKKWKIEHRGIVVPSEYCPNCGAKMDKE